MHYIYRPSYYKIYAKTWPRYKSACSHFKIAALHMPMRELESGYSPSLLLHSPRFHCTVSRCMKTSEYIAGYRV